MSVETRSVETWPVASCSDRAFVKSSHSNTGGNCVEVAAAPRTAWVRDSKRADAPPLRFSASAWRGLLDGGAQAPSASS